MKTIILNSKNVVSGSNNSRYQYNFPTGAVTFKSAKISLSSLSMFYSWFNITQAYNNNTYSYKWVDGTTVNITMPDGFYTVAELNQYLQSVMISNKHYLQGSSSNLFFIEFQENAVKYAVQVNLYTVGAVLPAGYVIPAGATWALNNQAPQLIINSNAFRDIIGFNAGTYPTVISNSNVSYTSQFTPQVSPVNSILMACNLINNNLGNSQILYSFSPNVQFGSQINVNVPSPIWNEVLDGVYSQFQIQFFDQDYNPMKINDNSLVIALTVVDDKEIMLYK